jgi:hypothetical protein
MLAVSVRDSGVGIEDQDPHRIFRVLHEQDYRRGYGPRVQPLNRRSARRTTLGQPQRASRDLLCMRLHLHQNIVARTPRTRSNKALYSMMLAVRIWIKHASSARGSGVQCFMWWSSDRTIAAGKRNRSLLCKGEHCGH